MARVTNQQALIAFFDDQAPLVHRDHNARSTKYVVYTSPKMAGNWYIGKAGAVRRGLTIKDSIPISETRRKQFIAEGKKLLKDKPYA